MQICLKHFKLGVAELLMEEILFFVGCDGYI